MEAISLILAALVAGAGTGIGNVTAAAIKDSYEALRHALRRKLAGEPEAVAAIDGYVGDQAKYEELLGTALWKAGVDRDDDIVSIARAIVAAADPQALPKFKVRIRDSQHIQIGDGNTQFGWSSRQVK